MLDSPIQSIGRLLESILRTLDIFSTVLVRLAEDLDTASCVHHVLPFELVSR